MTDADIGALRIILQRRLAPQTSQLKLLREKR